MSPSQPPLYPLAFGSRWSTHAQSLQSMQGWASKNMGWASEYDAIGDASKFENRQFAVSFAGLSLSAISHTPIRTRVTTDKLSFFLPVHGAPTCSWVNGQKILFETGRMGLLAPPGERIGEGGRRSVMIANLDPARLRATLRSMSGRDEPGFSLDRPLALSTIQGRANYHAILTRAAALLDSLDPDGSGASLLAVDEMFYRAIGALLMQGSPLLAPLMPVPVGEPSHSQLARACDYARAHLDERITLTDLETVSAMSARSLQYAFRKHFGCSPMEWVRAERLNAARAALLSPHEHTTVTSTALAVGMSHLSDFARYYFQMFQEHPSQTLAAAKGQG